MRILDLFCGAGGAAVGLHRAFPDAEIVGVDVRPMPRYPFTFVQGDALEFDLTGFDFVWASPPCQAYTPLRAVAKFAYPDYVGDIRAALITSGNPWIIENVPQAPLLSGIELCGGMFGLRVYRHRRFEASWMLMQPEHPRHVIRSTGTQRGRKAHYEAGGHITITGDVGTYCAAAMGIDWMNGNELSQAIPPAYSQYLAQFIPLPVKKAA